MWIMLNNAFISIVAKDCRPDELMVRARRPGDIERLFPETNGQVQQFTASDYHYRAAIKRSRVALVISEHIFGVDYSNFKDSVKDRPLHDAYMRVWHAMATLQPQAPYAGRPRQRRHYVSNFERALHDMPSDRYLDRLPPEEDAHLFATGHLPEDDFFPQQDDPKPARKKPAKRNTRDVSMFDEPGTPIDDDESISVEECLADAGMDANGRLKPRKKRAKRNTRGR